MLANVMAQDEAVLSQEYHLIKLSVASGTQLTTRAADIVKSLGEEPVTGKSDIVCLSTRSRNVNKLISIVEIAKRELMSKGVRVFQYNALCSEMTPVNSRSKQTNGTGARTEARHGVGDDSDDAFETMGEKYAEGPKQRVVPVMTTYLSTVSVTALKTRFG